MAIQPPLASHETSSASPGFLLFHVGTLQPISDHISPGGMLSAVLGIVPGSLVGYLVNRFSFAMIGRSINFQIG
jgi:hypothetical protein